VDVVNTEEMRVVIMVWMSNQVLQISVSSNEVKVLQTVVGTIVKTGDGTDIAMV